MDTLEVFALNIQPFQIAARLGCKREDTDLIALERHNFLRFLQAEKGRNVSYDNQLTAWQVYDSRNNIPELYTEEEMEFLMGSDFQPRDYVRREAQEIASFEDIDNEQADWVSDIHRLLLEQAIAAGVYDVDVDNIYYTKMHDF